MELQGKPKDPETMWVKVGEALSRQFQAGCKGVW